QGKTVTPAGTVEVGGEKASGGMVAITPDGKTALVPRNNDNKVSVLSIDGTKVEYTKRDMTPGLRPIVMDVACTGAFAVVGHLAGWAHRRQRRGDNDGPDGQAAAGRRRRGRPRLDGRGAEDRAGRLRRRRGRPQRQQSPQGVAVLQRRG